MFTGLKHKFTALEHMFTGLKHKFTGLKHKFKGLKYKMTQDEVFSYSARSAALRDLFPNFFLFFFSFSLVSSIIFPNFAISYGVSAHILL